MPIPLLLDEHVPRLLETTLSSNGYDVGRADDLFGERTDDEALLDWCEETGRVLLANDRTDFSRLGENRSHSDVFLYTDEVWVRDRPSETVAVIDTICSQYGADDLENEIVWLDQWRPDR